MMLKGFAGYIEKNHLVCKGDKILLAVSGGMDSVAMAELFHRCGYGFGIAHCNFGLRGKESDSDEAFVRGLAGKYRVPFYRMHFSTAKEAKERGVSVQMAARDLRYDWFEQVRKAEGYAAIATGHHLDDQIETFFINLLRGTGIAGLHGILPRNGKVIRPLLFATRDEIGAFVRKNRLSYCEDASNASSKYLRNRIRLELIPLLRELSPDFSATMAENMARIREAVEIYKVCVEETRRQLIQERGQKKVIRLDELKSLTPTLTWIYEIFSPFGFNEAMTAGLSAALKHPEKKEFLTDEWKVVKDRTEVVITRRARREQEVHEESYLINRGDKAVRQPLLLSLEELDYTPGEEIPAGREFATLDADKLEFPLALRRWKPGDAFIPFGMRQKKKVSDYFTDAKVSAEAKNNAWLLWSGQKIAWVVGHRPDNRFRVTSRTKRVVRIRLAG